MDQKPQKDSKGRFAKGNTLAKGRTPVPKDIKEIRQFNGKDFERVIKHYLHCSLEHLKELEKDETLQALDHLVIKVLVKAADTGDHTRLAFVLDRTIGKLPEKIIHEGAATEFFKKLAGRIQEIESEKKPVIEGGEKDD